MTPELLLKGFFALIYSGMFAWIVFDREYDNDVGSKRQRYLPYIPGMLLPTCILTVLICGFLLTDAETAMQTTLAFCFGVFLHICLYDLLLMIALPLLRRRISARACAVLWMLPNYLYLAQMNYMRLPEPRWVINAPLALLRVALVLWLAGFLAVLGWKIVSHLIFRARILKDASPVTDPAVLEVWRQEVEAGRFKNPTFHLVSSPNVQTPLSVGLFRRSIRVVLPERSYTPGELALVFRHELIHIGREDAWNKFFLVFCTAMCWFNPLMWTAMRKSSEDLELSCDETVLLESDSDTKRQYADLLLRTAGDERGFTTCLSASANALRYRLKSVVAPRKKPSGGLVVGLVFFLLCMSCGYTALAYGEETGAEVIYRSQDPEQYTLRINGWNDSFCTDEAALHRYLSSLRVERIAGNYSFEPEGRSLTLLLDAPECTVHFTLSDRFLKLIPLYGEERRAKYYYLPDSTDWDTLDRYMVTYPTLTVRVTAGDDAIGHNLIVSPSRVSRTEGDEVLFETDPRDTPGGIFGYPADRAVISLDPPLCGDFEVEIISLEDGDSRTITASGEAASFSLPEGSSRCIVRGAFCDRNGNLYQVEFRFELGDL